jgi:hypothetical protein
MSGVRKHLRGAVIGAVALASLAGAAGAQAFAGDWTISGEFARSTNPSFYGGFNPNDVDSVSATFDNRAKTVALQLEFFEAPERGAIYVAFGRGQTDGTCTTSTMDIAIAARDIVGPTQIEYGYSMSRYTPPNGEGWTYVARVRVGHEYYRYQWSRIVSGLDTANHERVAALSLDGVDGTLTSVSRVANTATEMNWSFGWPLLNGIQADCLEIEVPGHRNPYVIAPPATPAPEPTPDPTPAPAPTPAPDPITAALTTQEVELDDITTTATRRGTRVVLRMSGSADEMQVRIRKASKTLNFASTVAVRNAPVAARYIQVRFSDGTDWSAWDRIAIR